MSEQIRFGVLLPIQNTGVEPEFYKMAPEGVSIHFERLESWSSAKEGIGENLVTFSRQLEELGEDVLRATKVLTLVQPKVMGFACTAGSFLKGIEYDNDLAKKIEAVAGVPAVTTSTAVVGALTELGLHSIYMITPYPDFLTQLAKEFLEAHGFNVVAAEGLGALGPKEINVVPPEAAYDLAMGAHNVSCDGIFCSCTAWRTISIWEKVEAELGKPLVASNQALMWAMLKLAEYRKPITGFGTLMRRL